MVTTITVVEMVKHFSWLYKIITFNYLELYQLPIYPGFYLLIIKMQYLALKSI